MKLNRTAMAQFERGVGGESSPRLVVVPPASLDERWEGESRAGSSESDVSRSVIVRYDAAFVENGSVDGDCASVGTNCADVTCHHSRVGGSCSPVGGDYNCVDGDYATVDRL